MCARNSPRRAVAEAAPDVAVGWLVDKPAGPTSHDVVATVRRQLARRTKVGHTGTLDPFATGLMVVLAGRATRLARVLSGCAKRYTATVRLGEHSATGDPEGPITPGGEVPDLAHVKAAVHAMAGHQRQRVPLYSAVRVEGERLYAKARRGESVETPTREVTIHDIQLVEASADGREVVLDVRVSAGTYVRQIAADLGEVLGCGGYCRALRRTAIAGLTVDAAVPPQEAAASPPVPLVTLLGHLAQHPLDDDAAARVAHGIAPDAPAGVPEGGEVVLTHDGRMVALAERRGPLLQPRVVLAGCAPTPVLRA